MTLRTSKSLLGLTLLLFSGFASALGLGGIKMNSAMNEPMDAEVEILNLGDLTENEIQVKLASAEDFQKAGVERPFHLVGLRFNLDFSNKSRPLIRISSQKAVKEPYLNFLLEMRWSSGRMLREFTVLMDLPAFAREKPVGKPVTATRSTSSKVTSKPVPTNRGTSSETLQSSQLASSQEVEQPSVSQSSTAENTINADHYTVKAGDTLWAIAAGMRPEGATVQQTIMAIYETNPDAFINSNANLLRKGAVLRAPEKDEVLGVSHQRALSDLNQHGRAWQANTSSSAQEATVEAIAPTDEAVTSSNEKDEGGRLHLSAAVEGDKNTNPVASLNQGSAGVGSGSELIENDLAIAQEELERAQRENTELEEKVRMLEEQVKTMSRLIELEDSGLRAAQLAAESQGEEPAQQEETFSFSDIVAGDSAPAEAEEVTGETGILESNESSVVFQEINLEEEAETTVPGETDEQAIVEEELEAKSVSDNKLSTVAEPSAGNQQSGWLTGLVDSLKSFLLPLGGALLVLVGLIVLLKLRRSDIDESEMKDSGTTARTHSEESLAQPQVAASGDVASIEDEIELDEEDLLFAEATHSHAAGGDFDIDESDKVDVVGEADIYLSLGNHETAIGILLKALDQHPDDSAARVKLLEIYGEQKDEVAFDDQLTALQDVANDEVKQEASRMRAAFFGASAPSPVETDYIELPGEDISVDELASEDFDLDLESSIDVTEAVDELGVDLESDFDLDDLDLSPELELSDSELSPDNEIADLDSETATEPEKGGDGFDLDLDLSSEPDSLDSESVLADKNVNVDQQTATEPVGDDLDLDLDLDLSGEEAELFEESTLPESDELSLDSGTGEVHQAEAESSAELDLDLDLGEGFDLPDDSDELGTQLELAQAYFDMGDQEGAREILEYVSSNGNAEQQTTAQDLLSKLA